jgi:hypothetical protein
MRKLSIVALALILSAACVPAGAQFKDANPGAIKMGETHVERWRAGVVVKAGGAACKGIVGYMPLPTEWPEQQVKTVSQEISPTAHVTYQTADGTVRVMVVRIPTLPANGTAKAVLTLEVSRSTQLPPPSTRDFVLPDSKKVDRTVRPYLSPSPKIEYTNAKIRSWAKEVSEKPEKAWDKVEALYDATRKRIKNEPGSLQGALMAVRHNKGGYEDITAVFIALCRAIEVPARTVWVPDYCYAEFYLEDGKGEGRWFPCDVAGKRSFGELADTRLILEKGDNFRELDNPRKRLPFLTENLTAKGTVRPDVTFVREAAN